MRPTATTEKNRTACLRYAALLICAVLFLFLLPDGKPVPPATAAPNPASNAVQPVTLSFSTEDPTLLLVNRSHPLPADYAPVLQALANDRFSVAAVMYDDLCAMLRDGEKAGLHFVLCSAYRPTSVQQALYDEDVARFLAAGMTQSDALARTEQYTQRPGCSEHETGLAVDIVSLENQNLDDTQMDTPETRWLHEHCAEYGFILRYPSDKSAITGISFEPWHYRYVGKAAAKYLTEHDLTLEEFWSQTTLSLG